MAVRGIYSSAYLEQSRLIVEEPPPIEPDLEKAFTSLTQQDKKASSWQYHGYPALSRWMASANDFFVLRRFSPLQARCLLYLQNEISEYDRRLNQWDQFAQHQCPPAGLSGLINTDDANSLPNNPRPRLLKEVIPILQQYNDLVNSFAQLKSKDTASEHNIRNMTNWFETYPNAIHQDEQFFRNHEGDLFTLLPKTDYPLVHMLHRCKGIRHIFKLKKRADRIDDSLTTYTSDKGLETFAAIVIIVVGLAMSFGSIWWLNFVSNNNYRLAIITVSASLTTTLAWLAAGNRPFEILAAFAAYMAVLMIYRQISGGGGS